MIRHGARSAEASFTRTNGQSDMEIFGVNSGELTKRGVKESIEIGIQRRKEYVEDRNFLG